MYAKVENGNIVKYPYTEFDLRNDNPNTSFPKIVLPNIFEMFGAVEVHESDYGTDYTKNYVEGNPRIENGLYVRNWSEIDATEEEITERLRVEWNKIRAKRNKLLLASDWTQLPDSPLDNVERNAWADYRQSLRDITDQVNPFTVIFPEPPSA